MSTVSASQSAGDARRKARAARAQQIIAHTADEYPKLATASVVALIAGLNSLDAPHSTSTSPEHVARANVASVVAVQCASEIAQTHSSNKVEATDPSVFGPDASADPSVSGQDEPADASISADVSGQDEPADPSISVDVSGRVEPADASISADVSGRVEPADASISADVSGRVVPADTSISADVSGQGELADTSDSTDIASLVKAVDQGISADNSGKLEVVDTGVSSKGSENHITSDEIAVLEEVKETGSNEPQAELRDEAGRSSVDLPAMDASDEDSYAVNPQEGKYINRPIYISTRFLGILLADWF
jgi:hypothetical protein